MNIRPLFVALTGMLLLSSCWTPKNVVYFEDVTKDTESIVNFETF